VFLLLIFLLLLCHHQTGTKELVTPPLDGTILPGVTRQSILDVARTWEKKGSLGSFKVSERRLPIKEITTAAKENRLIEAFGAGTAAVVSPIKALHFDGVDYDVPISAGGAGPLTQKFWDELMNIQYAKTQDSLSHPWTVIV
jgi:branched-chain amino acid aminotransferase